MRVAALRRLRPRVLCWGASRCCSVTAQEEAPPPPAPGFRLGGFFVAVDPNIGLWNDRINPNWRMTFTDLQTQEKQRVPYAFSIQNRGPHAELAIRFQFGFVSCDATLPAVPEVLDVESGWELTFPLPLCGIRFGHAELRAPCWAPEAGPARVFIVDCAFGPSIGFQKAVSGSGMKGKAELTWRGELAMVGFVAAVLWSVYSVVMLPWTWQEFLEDLQELGDDELTLAFKALDQDQDGYISREDVQAFMRNAGEAGLLEKGFGSLDPDAFFNALDATGSGRVSFEQFAAFVQSAQDAQAQIGRASGGLPVATLPAGGLAPGMGFGLAPPIFVPPGPIRPGPRPPSW